MLYAALGGPDASLSEGELIRAFKEALARSGATKNLLVVPPDGTRAHSGAGLLVRGAYDALGGPERNGILTVLPALGTHRPMDSGQIRSFFSGVPASLFAAHDHLRDTVTLGELPASFLGELSGGRVSESWPCQVNRALVDRRYGAVVSVGQVVPHEVVGMANYTKNILVGLGGRRSIDLSHWLGAVCGLERIMGRTDTPVRRLLNEGARRFLSDVRILYALTVVGRGEGGTLAYKGLFVGDDEACYLRAAELAREVNVSVVPPVRTCVVRLAPEEYRSTWLGNKAVYRTRMALEDGASLYVLAPGVDRFGEAPDIDAQIRRHGYRGTPAVLKAVSGDPGLAENLAAAAHLIHGSTEGRFRVVYCTERLSRAEVEGVGYEWMPYAEAERAFRPEGLSEGFNRVPGYGEVFYVSNPALGLWSRRPLD